MSCSQSDLSAYHPLPPYTAEPRRGYEQTLHMQETPIVPLSIPNPPRQWRDQFVKQSKSGGVTLKVSNQRYNVPFPIHHGGTKNPVRGCVDLAKTENVTSVELKERTLSIWLLISLIPSLGLSIIMEYRGIYVFLFPKFSLRAGYFCKRSLQGVRPPQSCVATG